MAEDSGKRAKFDTSSIVGIVSLPIIVWHGCMMRDANLESHAANTLNTKQFEAGEQHRKEDRDDELRRQKSEMRPLLAVNTPLLTTGVMSDADEPNWDGRIEVINLGKGLALDVEVEWIIDADSRDFLNSGWEHTERTEPLHLASGQTASLARVPRKIAAIGTPERLKDVLVTGKLRLKAQTVDGNESVTEQSFKARFDSGAFLTMIEFGDLIPRAFDWNKQSFWQ